MHGNVWEWVQDHYHDSYQGAPIDGSAWESSGSDKKSRVLRGGSWGSNPGLARSADRARNNSDNRYTYIGFRVVCSGPFEDH